MAFQFAQTSPPRLIMLIPFSPIAPVLFGDFPMFERISFAASEAIQLLLFGNMKVNFDDRGTVLHQESFKFVDFSISAFPLDG